MFSIKNYYNNDGSPRKCYKCEGIEFTQNITNRIDYITMEYEVRCSNCDVVLGYWATGYFDPCFMRGVSKYLYACNALFIK